MRFFILAALCAAVMLPYSNAAAQESGQIGLSIGYPASVGVLWHPSNRFGVRADATFVFTSSETEAPRVLGGGLDRELETSGFGFGVSGLLYLSRIDDVSTYVSPRFAYSSTTTDIEGPELLILVPPGFPVPSLDYRIETSGYSVAGSVGVQYSPNRRFSVFGELGLDYTSNESSSSSPTSTNLEVSSFGLRSGVGIVWYFK
jgi:hypothetical protein